MKTKRILAVTIVLALLMSTVGLAAAPAATSSTEGIVVFDVMNIPVTDWVASPPAGGGVVGTPVIADGVLTLPNVGGGWPSTTLGLAQAITIPQAEWQHFTLYFDISVAVESAFSLFNIEVGDLNAVTINRVFQPDDALRTNVGDIVAGSYSGSLNLADVLAGRYFIEDDGDGGFILIDTPFVAEEFIFAGLRIHAVLGNVTIRDFRLVDYRPADTRPLPISDVDTPNSWALPYMRDALEMGIVGEYLPSGIGFRPDAPRWYIAQLLADFMVAYTESADLDEVVDAWLAVDGNDPFPTAFPDVDDSHPVYEQIVAMATMGVIRGGEFGGVFGFGPDFSLTRAEAAVGLTRMMEALGVDTANYPRLGDVFADWGPSAAVGGIPSWAFDSVAFMYYFEIMGNTTSGINLIPDGDGWWTNYLFSPALGFATQQLIAGMVRMMDTEWPDSPFGPGDPIPSPFDILSLPASAWGNNSAGGGSVNTTGGAGNPLVITSPAGWPSATMLFPAPVIVQSGHALHFDMDIAVGEYVRIHAVDSEGNYTFELTWVALTNGNQTGSISIPPVAANPMYGFWIQVVGGGSVTVNELRIGA
ncbi:MAG: S-layer homology domain-containing protein [Oscillospiraceae bacterium]|nr:S-layer homology domain-containing protein [Oscillospiraceae bacterium]